MQFEDSARLNSEPKPHTLPPVDRAVLIPAVICAGICIILMRIGLLFSVFFLVPLGICAVVYGSAAAWLGLVIAVLGNGVMAAGVSWYYDMGPASAGLNILYFSVMSLGFTWIMAGNPAIPAIPPVRTVFRFITAAVAGALVAIGMIFSVGGDEGVSVLIRSQVEAIFSSYIASSGADAAQQALMERLFASPDRIIKIFTMIILRGGALVSAFFLFFFSRQTALILARVFRRQGGNTSNDLMGFFVPRKAIWVLSLCLPVIILCRGAASLQLVEIAAWNLLVICAIMFLAQGGGVVLFNLTRKPMPGIMRLLCGVLLIFLMFSPGINVLALGLLVLVGIAETWLPLRKSEQITDNS